MIELLNTDCMEYMATQPDNAFDLAIVDPPYRDAKHNAPTKDMREKGGTMKNFGDKPDQIYFNEIQRISKHQIIWGANNFLEFLGNTNCFVFWYKQNPMNNYSDGELAWTSFQKVARCFNFPYYGNLQGNKKSDQKIHPTQKPRELYSWLLNNYAEKGQRILDTHLGSGSSAIAAHYFGVDFVGCEIDEDYFEAAKARFDKETRQIAMF